MAGGGSSRAKNAPGVWKATQLVMQLDPEWNLWREMVVVSGRVIASRACASPMIHPRCLDV